jgi:hypothetical protein
MRQRVVLAGLAPHALNLPRRAGYWSLGSCRVCHLVELKPAEQREWIHPETSERLLGRHPNTLVKPLSDTPNFVGGKRGR